MCDLSKESQWVSVFAVIKGTDKIVMETQLGIKSEYLTLPWLPTNDSNVLPEVKNYIVKSMGSKIVTGSDASTGFEFPMENGPFLTSTLYVENHYIVICEIEDSSFREGIEVIHIKDLLRMIKLGKVRDSATVMGYMIFKNRTSGNGTFVQ